jgi:hypothetical protein
MTSVETTRAPASVGVEKAIIALASGAYLALFDHTLPHGDALRIVRQIDESGLVWNPNHLLLDPLGYAAYHVSSALGLGLSALDCFELLAALATVISLILFHSVLVRAGVSGLTRIAGVVGLFASASFLALAGSSYFFMVQMPFLIGALYLCLGAVTGESSGWKLFAAGMLLAFATTMMFNNLLLVGTAGLAVGLVQRPILSWNWRNSAWLWAGAAVIGFPIFIGGYLASDTSAHLIGWLTSYQGETQSNLNEVYGTKWNLASLVKAGATTAYNLVLGNMLELAGLATVVWTIVSGNTIEFIPQWGQIALGVIVIPLVIAFHLLVAIYLLRRILDEPAARLLGAWLLAFVVFNFLWQAGDDIFWLQITPATWLLFLMSQGYAPRISSATPAEARRASNVRRHALAGFVVLLLTVNTINAVVPVSSSDFARRQAEHAALLRAGDLEIIPGWDQQKWMALEQRVPGARQLMLMNMAVAGTGKEESLDRLPAIVEAQLATGGRVIVGRLYDRDSDQLPWYGLAGQGWPRDRIQGLLANYCTRELGSVDDVVFRELHRCTDTVSAAP